MTTLPHHNPFAQPDTLYGWQVQCSDISEALIDALGDIEGVLSATASVLDGTGIATLYSPENTACAEMHAYIQLVASVHQVTCHVRDVSPVEARDWVSETQASITPQRIGRFIVLGSHHSSDDIPASQIPLWLDAGAAFGTGEHATTSGCLESLCNIAKRDSPHHPIRNVLDMGCGTAILGMGIARLLPCYVLAVDNDAVAVRVAKENIARNGLSHQMDALCSQGFAAPDIMHIAPYDIIIANILARPVAAMAQDICRALRPHGYAVLSGFYDRSVPYVMAHYRMAGMAVHSLHVRNHWATLTLRKRAA